MSRDDDLGLKFPDCQASHILSLFYECGMASSGSGGMEQLRWVDIKSWLECTDRQLTLWEVETIKEMSGAYVSEYHEASEPRRPQPYSEIVIDLDLRVKVASQVKSIFASLKEEQNRKK